MDPLPLVVLVPPAVQRGVAAPMSADHPDHLIQAPAVRPDVEREIVQGRAGAEVQDSPWASGRPGLRQAFQRGVVVGPFRVAEVQFEVPGFRLDEFVSVADPSSS